MNVGAWVWQDAIPSYKTSVLICAICGRLFSARRFCAFRAFCGRILFALLVLQRLLPPPELASVGGYFKNVGAWVWQDAIPSYKTSVLICAICGRLFSARRFCAFRAFCGRTPFALLVQQRLLHPLSLHLWEAIS